MHVGGVLLMLIMMSFVAIAYAGDPVDPINFNGTAINVNRFLFIFSKLLFHS
jgi:hypothetical protein